MPSPHPLTARLRARDPAAVREIGRAVEAAGGRLDALAVALGVSYYTAHRMVVAAELAEWARQCRIAAGHAPGRRRTRPDP